MQRLKSTKYSFQGLLVCLIALMVVYPLLHSYPGARFLFNTLTTGIVLFSVFLFSRKRIVLWVGLGFAGPILIFDWASIFSPSIFPPIIGIVLKSLFFAYFIYILLVNVFQTDKITTDLIYGSICIYLLLGLEWAYIYSILDFARPGSISFEMLEAATGDFNRDFIQRTPHYLYFSFTTLTTLGYGDIAPQTLSARMMTSLESILGQFYLTILVARLIGLHLVRKN